MPKRRAVFRPADGLGNQDFGAADAAGAEFQPAHVQNVERNLVAFADFTQDVFNRHRDVF